MNQNIYILVFVTKKVLSKYFLICLFNYEHLKKFGSFVNLIVSKVIFILNQNIYICLLNYYSYEQQY